MNPVTRTTPRLPSLGPLPVDGKFDLGPATALICPTCSKAPGPYHHCQNGTRQPVTQYVIAPYGAICCNDEWQQAQDAGRHTWWTGTD